VYQELLDSVQRGQEHRLSYLAQEWADAGQWRALARGKLLELLSFAPERVPADVRAGRVWVHDGVQVEEISWSLGYGPRCEAWVLKPEGATGRLPGVLGLHCHGGFKFYGKEKIAENGETYPLTEEYRRTGYEGVAWANALAREGYVVLVHDGFAFGSRAVPVDSLSGRFRRQFLGKEPGTPEYIRTYNAFAADHEHVLAKSFFAAGTTWPGVFSHEDRRALDYLAGRPDVDPDRLGCCGLSGGGLRSVLLAGTDDRLKATVTVGFMSTWQGFLQNRTFSHTWMLYVPGLPEWLDFADILTLHFTRRSLVLYGEEDPLFTPQGQAGADARLRAVAARLGSRESYTGSFYPGGHRFDRAMQAEAFAFLREAL
jgi:dienelactone hydrolase